MFLLHLLETVQLMRMRNEESCNKRYGAWPDLFTPLPSRYPVNDPSVYQCQVYIESQSFSSQVTVYPYDKQRIMKQILIRFFAVQPINRGVCLWLNDCGWNNNGGTSKVLGAFCLHEIFNTPQSPQGRKKMYYSIDVWYIWWCTTMSWEVLYWWQMLLRKYMII